MFSVIFEVNRRPERAEDYLELAKHLKPILAKIDGFMDNERFESKLRTGWLLSHSTWRDEKSVVRWRTEGEHHQVQQKGRFEIFQDYHLRVGEVVSDTAPPVPTGRVTAPCSRRIWVWMQNYPVSSVMTFSRASRRRESLPSSPRGGMRALRGPGSRAPSTA